MQLRQSLVIKENRTLLYIMYSYLICSRAQNNINRIAALRKEDDTDNREYRRCGDICMFTSSLVFNYSVKR